MWWVFTPKSDRAPGVHWEQAADFPELARTQDGETGGDGYRYRVRGVEYLEKVDAQASLHASRMVVSDG